MNSPSRFLWICGAAAILFCLALAIEEIRVQERMPNDPYLYSKGSWGQDYQDQWGHWKIGLTPMGMGRSAWDIETGERNPVVVAFIDSGLDYIHPEISRKNVWINEKEVPGNGVDDDKNGFVDDVIGWNFIDGDNNVWDSDGHGTFTAGVVAAMTHNGEGIAGINRGVKIMPVRALNFQGRGSASHMVGAVIYAVNNGARVINISIEQLEAARSVALQRTVDYAQKKGVVVIVAAGNQGRDTATVTPSALEHAITVAATDAQDKRMGFSNWGKYIRLSAPGEEILPQDGLSSHGGKQALQGCERFPRPGRQVLPCHRHFLFRAFCHRRRFSAPGEEFESQSRPGGADAAHVGGRCRGPRMGPAHRLRKAECEESPGGGPGLFSVCGAPSDGPGQGRKQDCHSGARHRHGEPLG
ncbi:MAG: S8 family serine peptidase [Deltaproteobacteria bacterium]|nr:S8 family serine peptidase [Deltaproteobacteria bacterium]